MRILLPVREFWCFSNVFHIKTSKFKNEDFINTIDLRNGKNKDLQEWWMQISSKLGLIFMDIGSPLTPSPLHHNYREHNGLTRLFTAKI